MEPFECEMNMNFECELFMNVRHIAITEDI